jgi:4,5-dihydroxyphthalate decarboxylase
MTYDGGDRIIGRANADGNRSNKIAHEENRFMAATTVHLNMVVPPAPWTRAIEDGAVSIPGVSWDCSSDVENAPARFIVSETRDVGENGVRRMAIAHLKGAEPVALPVWFGRELMQRNILVRRDSGLRHPGDLIGKRVGSHLSVESGTGGAVLMILEQVYGVPLNQVHWRMGDPASLPVDRLGLSRERGPADDDTAIEWLLQGDIDAMVMTSGARYESLFGGDSIDKLVAAHPEVRPLIDDPEVIAETYRRTKLYPITDLVVVRPGLAREHPGLPAQLVDAFSASNELASSYRSPEETRLAEREVELLGEDPHQYGLGENARHNLGVWIDFLYRLGAIERAFDPAEMFAPGSF